MLAFTKPCPKSVLIVARQLQSLALSAPESTRVLMRMEIADEDRRYFFNRKSIEFNNLRSEKFNRKSIEF